MLHLKVPWARQQSWGAEGQGPRLGRAPVGEGSPIPQDRPEGRRQTQSEQAAYCSSPAVAQARSGPQHLQE